MLCRISARSRSNAPRTALHGRTARAGGGQQRLAINNSAKGTAIVRRKQIEVRLAFTEENDFQHVIQQEGLVSMLASPIVYKERVVGVLNAHTDRQQRFNNDEKNLHHAVTLRRDRDSNARLYSRIFSSEEALGAMKN